MSERQQGQSRAEGYASGELEGWQQDLLVRVVRAVFYASIIPLVVTAVFLWRDGKLVYLVGYVLAVAVVAALSFIRRIPHRARVVLFLAAVYGVALVSGARAGLASNLAVFLLMLPFGAALFLGRRAGYAALGLIVLTMLAMGAVVSTLRPASMLEASYLNGSFSAWLTYAGAIGLVSVFWVVSQGYLTARLQGAVAEARETAAAREIELRTTREAAQANQRRAELQEWVATFSGTVAGLRDRGEICVRAARELAQVFGFYQVNVFLVDWQRAQLYLVAAGGAQTDELMATAWRVSLRERSQLTQAVQSGAPQQALLALGEHERFPESRLEVAIPIAVRGEVLGVLDIHTRKPEIVEDVLQLLDTLVDYLGASFDLLRSLEAAEARLQEMNALYAQYNEAAWHSARASDNVLDFLEGEVPARESLQVQELARSAMETLRPQSALMAEEGRYVLALPLVAGSIAFGYILLTRSVEKGEWEASALEFLREAAGRLALAMDHTRLLTQARQTSFYEEQLRRITDIVWRNPSMEVIMERSLQELGKVLDTSEASLHLVPGWGEER